jgi:hypothetical protein
MAAMVRLLIVIVIPTITPPYHHFHLVSSTVLFALSSSLPLVTMRVSVILLSLSILSLLTFTLSQTPLLTVVSSVQATKDRLTPQPSAPFSKTQPGGAPVLTLYPDVHYQSILGFGGALTEAAATTWLKLPAALQAEVITAYYNASVGNAYRWGRVPINSCDFTEFSYNFDNVTDDFTLAHFDTNATQDSTTIIPLIKAAQAVAYAAHTHTHTALALINHLASLPVSVWR